MTTSPKTIDYDAIFKELIKGLRTDEHGIYDLNRFEDQPKYLREFRTLRLGTGRQKGKTQWVARQMIKDPSSLALVVNTGSRMVLQSYLNTTSDRRILTNGELVSEMKRMKAGEDIPSRQYRQLFIDDASYVQDRQRFNGILRWVAKEGDFNRVIVMVG